MVGPIPIDIVFDHGIVHLVSIDENHAPLFANGHKLRRYHKPISKDTFTSQIAADVDYHLEQG